jgi:hypothetical protein
VVKITLNAFELRLCKALAAVRQETNDINGVIDHRIAKNKSSLEINFQGAKGEIALARFLNVYPDLTTQSRSGGCDLIFRGNKIDVKNRHPYRDLMTPATKKAGESDIYVCVTGDNPIILLGWCYENQFINPRRIVHWTPVTSYFVREAELNNIFDLMNIKEKEYVPKLSLEELALRGLRNAGADTGDRTSRGTM